MQSDSDNDPNAGFQYVEQRSARKNRKRRNNAKRNTATDLATREAPDLSSHLETRRFVMRKSGWLSQSSTWFAQCLKHPDAPGPARKIVCLALGSFSPDTVHHSAIHTGVASTCSGIHGLKQSQYQLVFLLDVIIPILSTHRQTEYLGCAEDQDSQTASPTDLPSTSTLKVSFFDPAFTEQDKQNLRKWDHEVLEDIRNPVFYVKSLPSFTCHTPPKRCMNVSCVRIAHHMGREEKDKIPVLMELDPDVINALPPPDLTQLNHDTGVHAFNETCFQWFTKSQHDKGTHQVAA
ncbi:hypothetical protein PCANC_27625 [Puccinia coronata f. sp. avenae]|uniref:SRR1-like domain-containing protein n=1 Tax=Puccinia coronata f. sp. avenae TaxID=200324 RepID=A0A2N5RVP4_9BASI|nr:hypothetical protein PCANC_27625 [Puccinia coronata f. sp. avenae]